MTALIVEVYSFAFFLIIFVDSFESLYINVTTFAHTGMMIPIFFVLTSLFYYLSIQSSSNTVTRSSAVIGMGWGLLAINSVLAKDYLYYFSFMYLILQATAWVILLFGMAKIKGVEKATEEITRKSTSMKKKKTSVKKKKKHAFCPVCHKKIGKNWVACPYCGTKIKGDTKIY